MRLCNQDIGYVCVDATIDLNLNETAGTPASTAATTMQPGAVSALRTVMLRVPDGVTDHTTLGAIA